MIHHGARRTLLDKRDYSFHRSYGTIGVTLEPQDYSFDAGLLMQDQNADLLPLGCTGYAQTDVAGDEDKTEYDPEYTYSKTCYIEGHGEDVGCSIRNSLKVGQAYGMKKKGETDDQALTHRRGAFFSVDKASGCDWFDSMRLAMRKAQKPLSLGTQWFHEWESTPDGILTSLFVLDPNAPWHNHVVCGEKVINGVPYLLGKSWQGKNYGDKGFHYFSRETFNKAFDVYGTCAFVQPSYTPKDINTIRLTLLQFSLYYLGRILGFQLAYA